MMFLFIQILCGVIINKFCFCVSSIPADSLMKNVFDIKESVFDLESKMIGNNSFLSLRTLLTSMDNNIKKIRETEYVWDILDKQSVIFDRKLDILSKTQDEIVDVKSILMSNMNLISFKIDNISTITNVIEKSFKEFTTISKQTLNNCLSLDLSNVIDYTFCDSVKNLSGIFKFTTRFTNLVDGTRDYGTRLCEEGWLMIQKRDTFEYQENFNRTWDQYKRGFGDLRKEFWFGNDFLNQISHRNDLTLRIELETFEGEKALFQYDTFKVGNEQEYYALTIGDYSGLADDSFTPHNNTKFYTFDKQYVGTCGSYYGSGWWLIDPNNCFYSNLNGIYYDKNNYMDNNNQGVLWRTWKQRNSMKSSKMLIKPKGNLIQFSDLTYKFYDRL